MKKRKQCGLDIAKGYWTRWGEPWMAARYPELLTQIGVGLFSGSDVLGADDDLSRDHGWGPRFDVFRLKEEGISNKALHLEITAAAPPEWEGFQNRFQFTPSIQVHGLEDYFGKPFPKGRLPESPVDWVCCPEGLVNLESHLHFFRHGAIFHDPAGILADVRGVLHTYPEDIWLLRMAQLCFDIAHYGEYNFRWRLAKRKDPVAAEIALGYFQHAVMALAVVMDRDYAPYWKLLHHVFRSREISSRLEADLRGISTTLEYEPRVKHIENVCAILKEELVKRNIIPADIDDGSGLPLFFQVRAYFIGLIKNPSIRAMME